MSFSLNELLLNPKALKDPHWVEVENRPGFWVCIRGYDARSRRQKLAKFGKANQKRMSAGAIEDMEFEALEAHALAEDLIVDWWHENGCEPFTPEFAANLLSREESVPLLEDLLATAKKVQNMTDEAIEAAAKNCPAPRSKSAAAA